MKPNKQQGFTLIELIIVIVILGILAVTASPKFLDLTGDARASSLSGLQGSLKGASNIVYSKALVSSQASGTAVEFDFDGDATADIEIDSGYPSATTVLSGSDLTINVQAVLELGTNEWDFFHGDTNVVRITPADLSVSNYAGAATAECYVEYNFATSASKPTITIDTDKC